VKNGLPEGEPSQRVSCTIVGAPYTTDARCMTGLLSGRPSTRGDGRTWTHPQAGVRPVVRMLSSFQRPPCLPGGAPAGSHACGQPQGARIERTHKYSAGIHPKLGSPGGRRHASGGTEGLQPGVGRPARIPLTRRRARAPCAGAGGRRSRSAPVAARCPAPGALRRPGPTRTVRSGRPACGRASWCRG
jgi:hypothetical protein